ncbi:MAG: YhcH/YjgK/YiaL family protein [Verrucomicrobiota bacterium]
MALYGSFATVRAQAPQTAGFATAFAYVEEVLRDDSAARARLRAVPVGKAEKVDLGDGVFVMEQAYDTKMRVDGFFESHRKYIDVQVVIEGEELMELVDASLITVKDAYNPDRDLITYQDFKDTTQLKALPGATAIFYPADVHMPSLRLRADAVTVRKAVVKVPVNG